MPNLQHSKEVLALADSRWRSLALILIGVLVGLGVSMAGALLSAGQGAQEVTARLGPASLAGTPAAPGAEQFELDARRAVEFLATGHPGGLADHISSCGLTLVKRWMVWEKPSYPYTEYEPIYEVSLPTPSDGERADLWTIGSVGMVWVEKQIRLSAQDVLEAESVPALLMFGEFMKGTQENYYEGVEYSLDLTVDHWTERNLGACAYGKVCSNQDWYAGFRQEKGEWRLHRLEIATH